MKLIYIIITAILLMFNISVSGQDTETKDDFGIKLSGYVNWSAIYDSRQTVNSREGHFLLYPKEKLLDKNGDDLNAVKNFNMAVIMSRVSGKITAPAFLGAKTTGVLEAEFMGNSDSDVNGLRIRHAWLNLNWGSTNLLLGQTWSPLFIPESSPDQIGSNAGAPFLPFARNPQIRLTQQFGDFKVIGALLTQRDFVSFGPNNPTASSDYLRNSAIPDAHFQVQFSRNGNLFGAGGEYKILKPAIKTAKGYYTDNTIGGFALMGFGKILMIDNMLKIKFQGIYGGNLTDLTMLGGYAVRSVDSTTMTESYTPIKTFAFWTDIAFGKKLEGGLFAGYSKNLGTAEMIKTATGTFYARGSNIDNVFRVAPRIVYSEGKVKAGLEMEYTTAVYGKPDNYGKIFEKYDANNIRIYTSVFYYF